MSNKSKADVPAIQKHECASAEELLEFLNPHNQVWEPGPSVWVYRGHGDSNWELLATAHRPGAFDKFSLPTRGVPFTANWERLSWGEKWILDRFRQELDAAGLAIPSRAPQGYDDIGGWSGEPPREDWPLRALAQHHGLPTSLLDWSQRARNAAYFAAVQAASNGWAAGNLDVWALRVDLLRSTGGRHDTCCELKECALRVVQAPRASNPNLHAQAGLFTSIVPFDTVLSVDQFITRYVEGHEPLLEGKGLQPPFMRRLSLAQTHAPKLLRLLSHEGVTGATMFPGCDGAANALRERALWDDVPT